MAKIKLESNRLEKRAVRYKRTLIEISPRISTELAMAIFNVVDDLMFEKDKDPKLERLPLLKCVYDMIIMSECTNLTVDGVNREDNKSKGFVINVNTTKENIEQFENSGLVGVVKEKIDNYDEVWGLVQEYVDNKAVLHSFVALGSMIPNENSVKKVMEQISKSMNEIQKNDRLLKELGQVSQEQVTKKIRNDSKKEILEDKKMIKEKSVKK